MYLRHPKISNIHSHPGMTGHLFAIIKGAKFDYPQPNVTHWCFETAHFTLAIDVRPTTIKLVDS